MKRNFYIFIVRWLFNSLGLWVALRLLGSGYENIHLSITLTGILLAGLIFSLVNTILKPIIVILSLPAILLTLGLFMIIVNGILVYISLRLSPGISMSFINSILTGMLLSLVNYIVSATFVLRSDNVS
jgi:putative membrane protein